MMPSLRLAWQETVHHDLPVERQHLLVGMVTLVRERVAAEEQDEGGSLGIDVPEGPFPDAVSDDVGDHRDVLREEMLVELLEQGGEDDLPVAAIDGVDEVVLAVEVDARLAEASEALDGGAALAQDLTRRLEPRIEQIAHDGAKDLLLVLEVAIERARRDAGLARDLGDAGAAVAEGREAFLRGGEDASTGRGIGRFSEYLHEMSK